MNVNEYYILEAPWHYSNKIIVNVERCGYTSFQIYGILGVLNLKTYYPFGLEQTAQLLKVILNYTLQTISSMLRPLSFFYLFIFTKIGMLPWKKLSIKHLYH